MLLISAASFFLEHPSWLKPYLVGMSFISFWSGTQLVRSGWVLLCSMSLLSRSLLTRWHTCSKPFVFRRLCEYRPTESWQGSVKQVVSSQQVYRFPFHGWGKCRGRLTIPLTTQAVPRWAPAPLWFHQVYVWQLSLVLESTWLPARGLVGGVNLGGDSRIVLSWDIENGHGLCLGLLFWKLALATWTA